MALPGKRSRGIRFNSPLGILVVRTTWEVTPFSSNNLCFNSPLGILVVRTAGSRGGLHRLPSFNSPLGILVVRTRQCRYVQPGVPGCFNSPLGILVVRTTITASSRSIIACVSIPRSEFWLFGHPRNARLQWGFLLVSIPRSEFWLFGRRSRRSMLCSRCHVSIPRSEFWLFGLLCAPFSTTLIIESFNSPLGILVVRTGGLMPRR